MNLFDNVSEPLLKASGNRNHGEEIYQDGGPGEMIANIDSFTGRKITNFLFFNANDITKLICPHGQGCSHWHACVRSLSASAESISPLFRVNYCLRLVVG